jgi:hypothetical protein
MLLMVTVHLADHPSLALIVAPLLLLEVTTVGMVPVTEAVVADGCMLSQGEITILLQSG